jgi:thiamine-phosphate pyrophosphorylase
VRAPRIVLVTATSVVPEQELHARLMRLARLDAAMRARVAVQLRDPELPSRELLALGARLRERTRALGVGLVVNDRLDLALAVEADGVHLGRRSVAIEDARALLGPRRPDVWISVSCHSVAEVDEAARLGADAVLLSPIFASPGKGSPLGLGALREARARLDGHERRPSLVALGGVDDANVAACFEAGADGVAAIRADLGRAVGAPR